MIASPYAPVFARINPRYANAGANFGSSSIAFRNARSASSFLSSLKFANPSANHRRDDEGNNWSDSSSRMTAAPGALEFVNKTAYAKRSEERRVGKECR